MAKSTFSGPVKSLAGFISAGNAVVVSLTADTSLTVASHAGKVLTCNDADGKFTLPTIVATAPGRDDDPNQTNNLGAQKWQNKNHHLPQPVPLTTICHLLVKATVFEAMGIITIQN